MKLDVPYHSQFTDIQDSYWMLRGCAIVCLKMVLEYYGKDLPIMDLIDRGNANGGYGKSGWFHDALINLAEENGVSAWRKEAINNIDGINELVESLRERNPVIVSGTKRFMEQTKFHQIVLTGFEEKDRKIEGFYYHYTENTDKNRAENDRERGVNRFVSTENFQKDWRGMAIFFKKNR